jgi:hypothetical protein
MHTANRDIVNKNLFDEREMFFLATGYFLDTNARLQLPIPNISQIEKYKLLNTKEHEDLFTKFWSNKINTEFTKNCNRKNLVLLSGGIDSRAILYELLKNTDADQINTLTFGSPGTLDYEIGNKIAKKLGTKHESIEIDDSILSLENINQFGRNIDFSTNLFLTMPFNMLMDYKEFNIWSGTVIDVYYGRHTHVQPECNSSKMVDQFINENVINKQYESILNKEYIIKNLNKCPVLKTTPHVLDLYNRQTKFVSNHLLLKEFKFINMLSQDLIDLSFAINPKELKNQSFYINAFSNYYHNFNDIGCKTTFGAKLNSSKMTQLLFRISNRLLGNKYENYLKWSELIKSEKFEILINEVCTLKEINLINKFKESSQDPLFILNYISLLIIKNSKIKI